MILVDIHVPAMDKTFDFELDEEMPAGRITEKIKSLVACQEQIGFDQEEKMFIYSLGKEKVLSDAYTLKEQGIENGERLVLL